MTDPVSTPSSDHPGRRALVAAFGASASASMTSAEWSGSVAPGVNGMASGLPVSSREILTAPQALERIARALHAGNFDEIEAFDGPYVVAVQDTAAGRVRVLRDKFGLRQAYHMLDADGTLHVSDDIARLPGRETTRVISIGEWLHYGTPLAPQTFYESISTLPAGSWLERVGAEPARVRRWFSPESYVDSRLYEQSRSLTIEAATDRFLQVFETAVRDCVGGSPRATILFSGGIDSSLLAAVMQRVCPVDAVTIDIRGPGAATEVHYAREMAAALGKDIHLTEVPFGPLEFVRGLPRTVRDQGQPIIIDNAIALNHAAHSGALPFGQRILDGEGADALMAGSTPLFKYSLMVRHVGRVTGLGSARVRAWFEKARDIMGRLGLATTSTLDGRGLDVDLLARRMELSELETRLRRSFAHLPEREDQEIAALMLREFYDYLVPLMLRIDSMSAIVGSHTILPYLARPVFEFLENLPMGLKVATPSRRRGPLTKAMLKSALARFAPASLIYKPKIGFGIPGSSWITMPPAWRDDLWIAEAFRLPRSATDHFLDHTQNRDLLFFCSLEVWGRMHARKLDYETVSREWNEHNEAELARRGVVAA